MIFQFAHFPGSFDETIEGEVPEDWRVQTLCIYLRRAAGILSILQDTVDNSV